MKEAFWIIDQLIQQGVVHFCIAPGSRSTPLALAIADHPKAQRHVHFDERGLGFYTLGIGLGSKKPAVIIVTSGTAVGNLLPSVMEAHHSAIPLILLTADRPPELRDCSANQSTDQAKIFQPFVRWQVDLPCTGDEAYFRSIAAQAFFYTAQNPPGPVQVNCQFREPFCFEQVLLPQGKQLELQLPKFTIGAQTSPSAKGMILVGRLPKDEDVRAILKLAEKLKWPIFADLLSNARNLLSFEQIRNFDWILKKGSDLRPDAILHFGERLTSKKCLEWQANLHAKEYLHVSPLPFLQDPERLLTRRIQADISSFCASFTAQSDPNWLKYWKEQDAEIDEILDFSFANDALLTEAHAMRTLSKILPPQFAVYLGSGMPIRDANNFLFPEKCRGFFANRGLSGIDGNIATAIGLSNGLQSPLLIFIGDQASLHDLNSLALLKKAQYPVFLIISNNFGSGIFSHLPVSHSPHSEELFGAAHKWSFEGAVKMFDLPYVRIDSSFEEKMRAVFSGNQSAVIELISCRTQNYQFHKRLTETVQTNTARI
ncbi:MAG: 2-succinyl-5-enolpyruvyl-6-hydroxy-3-cyclohexene-1-carboxylic-acid synthase [Chlamydiota bacterium]